MTALSFVFALVAMLGVLIFVHEFGHFIVAKWCGVRVLKFSLGFGPAIGFGRFRLAWERGGTEYVIAWFPLGGFVKMLGENLDEQDEPEAITNPEESFEAKPVWQKLAIVFAGPAMNLMLPVVVFTANLAVGLPRPAPVVGSVEAQSPAAQLGVRPGDTILQVGGEPVRWWSEVEEALRARPGQSVPLALERNGQPLEIVLEPGARTSLDEFGLVTEVGWSGLAHPRLRALLGIPDADSPAARAGLRSGDRVVAVGEVEIEDWEGLAAAVRTVAGSAEPVPFHVERGDANDPERLTIPVPVTGDLARLGMLPANVLIASVEEDSPAAEAGLQGGDLIVSADGRPVGSFSLFADRVRTSGGTPIELVYARNGRTEAVTVAPKLRNADTGLGVDEERYMIGIAANPASLPGALEVDRETNPLVSVPRAVGMTVDVTTTFLRGLGKIVTGEVSRKQIAGPIGIAVIAHNALQRGWEHYLSMLVLISINLGILNLLPIPVLDGGQALIFAIEGIKRSPVSLRTREFVQQLGVLMILALMGMAFWNDISRYWTKVIDYVRQGVGL